MCSGDGAGAHVAAAADCGSEPVEPWPVAPMDSGCTCHGETWFLYRHIFATL